MAIAMDLQVKMNFAENIVQVIYFSLTLIAIPRWNFELDSNKISYIIKDSLYLTYSPL